MGQAMDTLDTISIDRFPVGCLVSDHKREILYCNRYIETQYGYSPQDLIGTDLFALLSKASQIMYDSYLMPLLMRKGYCGEIRVSLITRSGNSLPTVISARRDPAENGRIYWSISSATRTEQLFEELTKTKKILKQKVSLLRNLSDTDQLTGLPNRSALTQHLEQKINNLLPNEQAFALAFIDLDGFKDVNDRHGHHMGDSLLRMVAKRLANNLRVDDLIARFGGDEFVIFLDGHFNARLAEESLTRLISKLSEPFNVDGVSLQVSASIGVTFYPQSAVIEPDQLIRQADHAMYQAKLAGRNQLCLYNAKDEQYQKERHTELAAIRDAMAANQFELYYQPKVNMQTGKVLGAEALLRWNHPIEGLKGPATFLPVLNQTTIGLDLGRWVIINALTQLQTWLDQGLDIHVSVNIDGYHLQHPAFLNDLERILADSPNLPNQRFELEILETSAIEDVDQVSTVITACRMMGIRISLDDFGTGYSSLAHLRNLSVDILKIDRSFVQDMLTSSGDLAILRGMVGFARAFECDLVAEGVETLQHGQRLLELGCVWGQGFYIARPMPAQDFKPWVKEWQQQGYKKKFKEIEA